MTSTQTSSAQFKTQFESLARQVEQAMEGYLAHDPTVPKELHKAMLYSLRAGGKRIRPVMLLLACQACQGEQITALPAAAAMEMIHTYSLIHDDLPAMDDDDLRRGKPTSHKVFGEDLAILAGDALLTSAFSVLAQHIQQDALARQLMLELAHAAGAAGMIGGQVADVRSDQVAPTLERVAYIHTNKTAMLFRAAARMGGLCAQADPPIVDILGDYGLRLGLAYQIIDDLLDLTATPEQLGKATQKDAAAGKLTYPAIIGAEASQQQADKLINQALTELDRLGPPAQPLRHLAEMIAQRKN